MTQPVPPDDVAQPPEPVVDETLTPLEAAFYALVLAALTVWLSLVAARILRPFNLGAFWSTIPAWSAEVSKLVAWLRGNAAPHGWERFDEDNPDVDLPEFPSTDAFIVAHMARVANYLVRIPEEVYDAIVAEIADGQTDGDSIEEIAERIDNILRITGSENWPARARVISITEVNGSANAGWFAAALQTEEILGQRLNKEWLSASDTHVRPAHRDADGQRQPLRQPFRVGGELLMYPGDKSGSPENVINCRCAATTTEAR